MTKKDLEQVYYLDRELKMWEGELNRLRSQSFVGSPSFCAVRGEGIYDKVGERAQKIIDLETRINAKREEIQNTLDEIVRFVADIPDSLTRMIVYDHCVKLMSWTRVAIEVGGNNTDESVRKIYARFMKNLPQPESEEPAAPCHESVPSLTPRPLKKNPSNFFRSTMDFSPPLIP